MKKFSIITICLNIEKQIGDTIASVLSQTYTDFEYIIKDGVSGDRTVSIAQSFAPAFADRGIPYRVISQPDKGVYDAMNQAVREAQGEWVLFMNAGDRMADDDVLSMVAHSGRLDTEDIVYGDRYLYNDGFYLYSQALPIDVIPYKMPFCHQSVFTRRALLEKSPYSLNYRLCSDYRFYLLMYLEGRRFAHLLLAVSIYDINGMSSDYVLTCTEKIKIHKEMPSPNEDAIKGLQEEIERCRQSKSKYLSLFAKLIPQGLRKKRRERMRKAAGWKTEEEFMAEKAQNGGRVNKPL